MLNPGAWNWRNYAGFFWAALCFLSIIYTYFRLPEPMGRTFAELDLLFEKRIPARKFKQTQVDVFAEEIEDMAAFRGYEEKVEAMHRRESVVRE
jgi:SP family general alpha glucoside:H+ symporter-like MFS transporter